MLTADARARASAWALARRARAWTLAYSGMAIAARMPMIATTIINSMRVKPRWLPSILRFKNLFIALPPGKLVALRPSMEVELLLKEGHAGAVPGPRRADLAGRDGHPRVFAHSSEPCRTYTSLRDGRGGTERVSRRHVSRRKTLVDGLRSLRAASCSWRRPGRNAL